MTETDDAAIIQLELPADDLFSDISLEGGKSNLVHASDDPHMADIDGGVSAAPSEIDVIAFYGLERLFVGSNGGRGKASYLWISADHAALVTFTLEIESVIPYKPHNTPAAAADIGNPFLRHPGVHDKPIGETMAPFTAVAVEVDGVDTAQFCGCDEVQPIRDERRDGIGEEGYVFGGDESLLAAIGSFVPVRRGGRDKSNPVDRPGSVIPSSGKGRSLPHVEEGGVNLDIVEHEGMPPFGESGFRKKGSLDNKAAWNSEISLI